jgi:S1-C subfamily serine protease
MDQNNTPSEPTNAGADSSAAASDAARIAAVADAEAANAVRAAEAALQRANSARAALAHAEAARAAALNAAAAQASADRAAADHAAAVRASHADFATDTAGAASNAVGAPSSNVVDTSAAAKDAPVAAFSPAPVHPDAMTTQKVFYNATAYPGSPAGTDGRSTANAGAGVPPEAPAQGKPSAFRGRTAGLVVGGVAAIAIALGGGGYALGSAVTAANASTSSAITTAPDTETPDTTTLPDSGDFIPTVPFGGGGQNSGGQGSGSGGTSTDTSTEATPASAEQTEGVVTIVSTLYYDETTQAAGTGVILSSDGQILTNNHVIEGSTSIEVTVESTGRTYSATVVGTDATNDIALLQLDDASGLDVVDTDESTLTVGDAATSVGNAEGTGDLVAAAGTITALNESITVGNEYTGAEESLSGLIEVDADVVSGDSGGPLVDTDGEVVGIVTAASSGSANITGYAIPIETALDIVAQIESGTETATVQIGLPAFLGVQLATTQQAAGVTVGGVIADTPAATAGLAAGDVITAVDGTTVTTAEALSTLIAGYDAGDSVTVSYTDASGTTQQVTVTLMAGPAA